MANVKAECVYSGQNGAARVRIYTWGKPTSVTQPGNRLGNQPTLDPNDPLFPPAPDATLKVGDTCIAEFQPAMTDKCMQVTGVAGGASINLTGSHDGVNFVTLKDVFGTPLSAVAPGTLYQINEMVAWIQPVVVGGGVATALNVIIAGKLPF